jgi:hypothetical protein
MVWEIKEAGNCILQKQGVTALTDEELVSLYTLLAYSSNEGHIKIAKKIANLAEVAKHSIHTHHAWENEGGTVVNGSEYGTHSSSPSSNT